MTGLIIVLAVIVVLIIIFAAFFNGFVSKRNRVDNAWAQVEVQLQRRHDLIPNLVETVKGYASHESGTFQKITEARTAAMGAKTVEDKVASENILTDSLKSLFAVAEAYPELKANTNFLDLQQQLKDTEDKISIMRQSYNDTVLMFNTAIQKFPGNIFASLFHFTARTSYSAETGAAEAPKVIFVGNNEQQGAQGQNASKATQGTDESEPAAPPADDAATPPVSK